MSLTFTMPLSEVARYKQVELPAHDVTVQYDEYDEEVRRSVTRMLFDKLYYNYQKNVSPHADRENYVLGPDFDWKIAGPRLHKRIKTLAYRRHEVSLDDEFLRSIADVAAAQRNVVSRAVDSTSAFTWRPGDFADNRSCYFNQYRKARLRHLPRIGASAVRTFEDNKGDGRYWIFPIPIFNEQVRDVPLYVAFNPYGAPKDNTLLYKASIVDALQRKWNREFTLMPVSLGMDECYINGDGNTTIALPADYDLAEHCRITGARGVNMSRTSNEPLQPVIGYARYDGCPDYHVMVGMPVYDSVGLPIPKWTKWADGRYCHECREWDYIANIKFRNREAYCSECYQERFGSRTPQSIDPDDFND